MDKYLPKRLLPQHTPQEWVDLVINFHSVLKGKSVAEIKEMYRKQIKNWNLYGAIVFNVKQTTNSKLPKDLWLAVHENAIHLLAPYTETPIVSYDYPSVAHYGPSASSFFMMTGNLMNAQKNIFMTKQASVMANLILIYSEHNKRKHLNQL